MRDAVTLQAGSARVDLAPEAGGSVAAFSLAGVDVLRPTPRAARDARSVLDHAAYPLVPYSNRIADARFAFGGRDWSLRPFPGVAPHSLHGVGWQRPWTISVRTDTAATLVLTHTARGDTAADWPFAFAARQEFSLTADTTTAVLQLTLALENHSGGPFPCGLGWHPFFPRLAGTMLRFDASGRWENSPRGLPAFRTAPEPDGFAAGRTLRGLALDHVYYGWRGSAELRCPERALTVTLTATEPCRHLVVYAPMDGDFVAVEPVTQVTDGFNRMAAGEADTGTRVLEPGATISCSLRICATLSP